MGGDSRLQRSMAVMAAIKKGMASVGELKDKCNDAIRKGVDVNGIAERQRIPVGGVHGRNYIKLVRDDVKESMKETALAKGKAALLPGFGDNLNEEQKVGPPRRNRISALSFSRCRGRQPQPNLLPSSPPRARRLTDSPPPLPFSPLADDRDGDIQGKGAEASHVGRWGSAAATHAGRRTRVDVGV